MSKSQRSLRREDEAGAPVFSAEDVRHRERVAELTRLHGAFLTGLAHQLCRGQLDPEDLVQDVFEKTMQGAHAIPAGANERAWLARVLRNVFIDRLRRISARREQPIEEDHEMTGESDAWWAALTTEAIREQLAKLPADQRVTFERFAFEGKSYDEIAAELAIAKGTVGTRILRARLRLRELLTAERGDG